MGGQHWDGPQDVVIVGAGIIGLGCAAALQARGRQVLLLDPAGIAEKTSKGNAGALAAGEILPLASPGIIRKAPRWFFDPLGPLSIPIAYLPRILPWLWHFWRASTPAQVRRSVNALAALMTLSERETASLYEDLGLTGELRPKGALHLYESEAEFRRALPDWAFRDAHGIPYEHIGLAEIQALEPALSPRFIRATRVPQWTYLSDPYRVAQRMGDALLARGAAFRRAEVSGIRPEGSSFRLALTGGEEITAAQVVLAAGAWSGRLCALLGDSLPLECERGYNTTLTDPGISIDHELIFGAHGFVAVQLDIGLRIGGAGELAGLERPPDYRRSKAMLQKAKGFLPGLQSQGGVEWMGHRPSLPDSLPVISPARRHKDLFYAFGHGHLGLTQAAATGRLIAEIACGEPASIDLAPFAADRF